jgi:hypothetical protein
MTVLFFMEHHQSPITAAIALPYSGTIAPDHVFVPAFDDDMRWREPPGIQAKFPFGVFAQFSVSRLLSTRTLGEVS